MSTLAWMAFGLGGIVGAMGGVIYAKITRRDKSE